VFLFFLALGLRDEWDIRRLHVCRQKHEAGLGYRSPLDLWYTLRTDSRGVSMGVGAFRSPPVGGPMSDPGCLHLLSPPLFSVCPGVKRGVPCGGGVWEG